MCWQSLLLIRNTVTRASPSSPIAGRWRKEGGRLGWKELGKEIGKEGRREKGRDGRRGKAGEREGVGEEGRGGRWEELRERREKENEGGREGERKTNGIWVVWTGRLTDVIG